MMQKFEFRILVLHEIAALGFGEGALLHQLENASLSLPVPHKNTVRAARSTCVQRIYDNVSILEL
ncbi:hypothetical protein D3C78_741390 [compost metagenome]